MHPTKYSTDCGQKEDYFWTTAPILLAFGKTVLLWGRTYHTTCNHKQNNVIM